MPVSRRNASPRFWTELCFRLHTRLIAALSPCTTRYSSNLRVDAVIVTTLDVVESSTPALRTLSIVGGRGPRTRILRVRYPGNRGQTPSSILYARATRFIRILCSSVREIDNRSANVTYPARGRTPRPEAARATAQPTILRGARDANTNPTSNPAKTRNPPQPSSRRRARAWPTRASRAVSPVGQKKNPLAPQSSDQWSADGEPPPRFPPRHVSPDRAPTGRVLACLRRTATRVNNVALTPNVEKLTEKHVVRNPMWIHARFEPCAINARNHFLSRS